MGYRSYRRRAGQKESCRKCTIPGVTGEDRFASWRDEGLCGGRGGLNARSGWGMFGDSAGGVTNLGRGGRPGP